jgi:hypothetical protein
MQAWQTDDFIVNIDDVLRSQGADPDVIRSRSPQLVEVAERAIAAASGLLEPKALSKRLAVREIRHERVLLEDDILLQSSLLSQHLRAAQFVQAIICTIGSQVEALASRVIKEDFSLGLAIDGLGSAAVEALANAACRQVELQAEKDHMRTSIPLSPGMQGWPVEAGQPVLFSILEPAQIGVFLTPDGFMLPMKTLSMIVGIGTQLDSAGSTCEHCAMRETCRYQDHYAKAQAE